MSEPVTVILSGTVYWSDGTTLFDGWLLLGLGVPKRAIDTSNWPSLSTGGKYPAQRLPLWTFIPIVQGVIDQNTKVLVNTSIDPPGSRYGAYWYDLNKERIYPTAGTPATPFEITSTGGSFAITIPTLPLPTTNAAIPDAGA